MRLPCSVLTKVDDIPEGETTSWIRILAGAQEKLKLGYYAVRNPSSSELKAGITHRQARRVEATFFSQSPWRDLPRQIHARCGASNLAEKLSAELDRFIVAK